MIFNSECFPGVAAPTPVGVETRSRVDFGFSEAEDFSVEAFSERPPYLTLGIKSVRGGMARPS